LKAKPKKEECALLLQMDYMLITAIISVIMLMIATVVALTVWKKRKETKTQETNYKAFFVLGICFMPLGVVLSSAVGNFGFIGITMLGVVYFMIGIVNKDKWEE
jgi:Gpi18-like mannosyltransferase